MKKPTNKVTGLNDQKEKNMNLLFVALALSGAMSTPKDVEAYKRTLMKDMEKVIKEHKACTQAGYDLLYHRVTIISLIEGENLAKDRADFIFALRAKCKNKMKSFWESEGEKQDRANPLLKYYFKEEK